MLPSEELMSFIYSFNPDNVRSITIKKNVCNEWFIRNREAIKQESAHAKRTTYPILDLFVGRVLTVQPYKLTVRVGE